MIHPSTTVDSRSSPQFQTVLRRQIFAPRSQQVFASHMRNTEVSTQESPAIADNPRDAKACQKLLQFDVLTTLSLTILAYLHSFSCCCVRNLRYPAKFTENSNLWSSRSSKVIDLGVNRKPMYDFLLVTNSNFGRICYRSRDIDAWSWKIAEFPHPTLLWTPIAAELK